MVKVELLLGSAMNLALSRNFALHEAWVKVQHKFGGLAGVAHLPAFAWNSRLDILLRELEKERLERFGEPFQEVEFVDDFLTGLSESWVSRSYEMLRAAKQRCAARSEKFPEALNDVFGKFELVRMAIDKGEIAKANRRNAPNIALEHEDGSDPREYVNDGN
jgi:hypothetical protein